MLINFGCGKQVLDGWFNVDAVRHPKAPRAPDLLYAMSFYDGVLDEQMPLKAGCADALQAMHVIEHFYRYDVSAVLKEWRRVLKVGGRLILELPNLEQACKNLLDGMDDQMCMWPIYGDWGHGDPYMMHRHGYTPKTIMALLNEHDFRKITMQPPQTHGRRLNRDMRVEAVK